jgi:hypothetical protein
MGMGSLNPSRWEPEGKADSSVLSKKKKDYDYGEELFLTPFISSGRVTEGRRKARVEGLLPSEKELISYSAFLTVDEKRGSNLFFWFFPAQVSGKSIHIRLGS